MPFDEKNKILENRQGLSRQELTNYLWWVLTVNWVLSFGMAVYGIIDLYLFPPYRGASCKHLLPILLHLLFSYWVYRLHFRLYWAHFRRNHYEIYGVDIAEYRDKQESLMYKELLARSRIFRFFEREEVKEQMHNICKYILWFIWLYEVIAVLLVGFTAWGDCYEDDDPPPDDGPSLFARGTPVGYGSYNPANELMCCHCPGVFCPVLMNELERHNPQCPCTKAALLEERLKEQAENDRLKEIQRAAANGTILTFLPNGTRVYTINQTWHDHQAYLKEIAPTTLNPNMIADVTVESCSASYLRPTCGGLRCFYSDKEYDEKVPANCRKPKIDPSVLPTKDTVTSPELVLPNTRPPVQVTTPLPRYVPPDYANCIFDRFGPWSSCSEPCGASGRQNRVATATVTDPPQAEPCNDAQISEQRKCNTDKPCVTVIKEVILTLNCEDRRLSYQCESGYACLRRLSIGDTVMLDPVMQTGGGVLFGNDKGIVKNERLRRDEPVFHCNRQIYVERGGVGWWYDEESLVHIQVIQATRCPLSFLDPNNSTTSTPEPVCPKIKVIVTTSTSTTTINEMLRFKGEDILQFDEASGKYRRAGDIMADRLAGSNVVVRPKSGAERVSDCYPAIFIPFVAENTKQLLELPCPNYDLKFKGKGALNEFVFGCVVIIYLAVRIFFLWLEKKRIVTDEVREVRRVIHQDPDKTHTDDDGDSPLGFAYNGKLHSERLDGEQKIPKELNQMYAEEREEQLLSLTWGGGSSQKMRGPMFSTASSQMLTSHILDDDRRRVTAPSMRTRQKSPTTLVKGADGHYRQLKKQISTIYEDEEAALQQDFKSSYPSIDANLSAHERTCRRAEAINAKSLFPKERDRAPMSIPAQERRKKKRKRDVAPEEAYSDSEASYLDRTMDGTGRFDGTFGASDMFNQSMISEGGDGIGKLPKFSRLLIDANAERDGGIGLSETPTTKTAAEKKKDGTTLDYLMKHAEGTPKHGAGQGVQPDKLGNFPGGAKYDPEKAQKAHEDKMIRQQRTQPDLDATMSSGTGVQHQISATGSQIQQYSARSNATSMVSHNLANAQILTGMSDNLGNTLIRVIVDSKNHPLFKLKCRSCRDHACQPFKNAAAGTVAAPNANNKFRARVFVSTVNDYALCADCYSRCESLVSCWSGRISDDLLIKERMKLARIMGVKYRVNREYYIIRSRDVVCEGEVIFKLKAKLLTQIIDDPFGSGMNSARTEQSNLKSATSDASKSQIRTRPVPLLGIELEDGSIAGIERVEQNGTIHWSDKDVWPVYDDDEKAREDEDIQKEREEWERRCMEAEELFERARLIEEARIAAEEEAAFIALCKRNEERRIALRAKYIDRGDDPDEIDRQLEWGNTLDNLERGRFVPEPEGWEEEQERKRKEEEEREKAEKAALAEDKANAKKGVKPGSRPNSGGGARPRSPAKPGSDKSASGNADMASGPPARDGDVPGSKPGSAEAGSKSGSGLGGSGAGESRPGTRGEDSGKDPGSIQTSDAEAK